MRDTGPRIAVVAGELSGDTLGGGLLRALKARYPHARFLGVPGPAMVEAGCEALAGIDDLSLFGLGEVLREIPRLIRLRRHLIQRIIAWRPDVFIGIDAPSFNTGLERRLRLSGIPTVHYVCPTAWAWRERRVYHLREAADMMLSIFPFEEAFFRRHHVPVRFVGHPLADELPLHPDGDSARRALGLAPDVPWVGILPGSRNAEVDRLGPRFLATARWLRARLPEVRFVIPVAKPSLRAKIEAQRQALAPELDITLINGRAREVMRAASVVLTASGTATLEALLAKTPMVVAYAVSPVSYHIARTLDLIKVRWVSMPNLLADRMLVPEVLQNEARPEVLGPWLYRLLTSQAARTDQIDAFESLHEQLRRGANQGAARAVAEIIESPPWHALPA
ncbi:lipid-A-disaccharide synthase [Spectribacter hydrogenoxidans]|uniref:Lipid-A-disaccharide synthase n=1 Tax=Spectribacter hydrogenoxidans TaxID=3075608 RepID=A0ABU3C1F7_9GAMM|nr:lipid-A-disaccharide synthase [Salinisphaera sp. W335]MDT0635379.1 lipid-A-disaccharide synthase [Salinisphaera sp. W335]